MPARVPLTPQLAEKPFPVRDALMAGVQPTRLRSTDLARPFWGVRTTLDAAATRVGKALAYLSRAAPGHFISHASAAIIWDISLPWRLQADSRLHVSVRTEQRAPHGRVVVGHRLQLSDGDVVVHQGIRVTSLARTWCDLATMLGVEDLVAAGDNTLWRRRPNFARLLYSDLIDAAARYNGRRGRPAIVASLPLLTDRADSPPESVIRVRMIRAGLPGPQVNLELYDYRGRFLAMPDLSYRSYALAFDYEGGHHRTDTVQ